MLQKYFRSWKRIDEIKASWLGPQIERYVEHLASIRTSELCVRSHVNRLLHFGEFARERGAKRLEDLPPLALPFVETWVANHHFWPKGDKDRRKAFSISKAPVDRFLLLTLPGYQKTAPAKPLPFLSVAPGFFSHLEQVRGLSEDTRRIYAIALRSFEEHLKRTKIPVVRVTSSDITAFVVERGRRLGKDSMRSTTSALRSFLHYAYAERIIPSDLEFSVPRGRHYAASRLPRAIAWHEVEHLLASIDRRSEHGKRDYAIICLIASYALRAREIAALKLEHIGWDSCTLRIPLRKGGHSTAYPLSETAGEALIDYLKVRRDSDPAKGMFVSVRCPFSPLHHWAISSMVSARMRSAGIIVSRAGSHTLRHSCVQHLINSGVAFPAIANYVGHRSTDSTMAYGKVALQRLRELVAVDGEAVL